MPRIPPRLVAPAIALLVGTALVPAAPAVGGSGSPRLRVAELRRESRSLDARAHGALLELYAIETGLGRAQARLVSLDAGAARIRSQRLVLRRQLEITKHALAVSQRLAAIQLRTLYEDGGVDPLAVLLGSRSLDQALAAVDALDRLTSQSESVIEQTSATRQALTRLAARLAARSARLASLTHQAEATAAALTAERTQRIALVAGLRARERLDGRTVAGLESAARAATAKSQQLAAAAAEAGTAARNAPPTASQAAAPDTVPAAPAGQTLTVVATGYSIRGRTATGVSAGWGVAAVDPTLIPLGTRFTVPGYGDAYAADVGGSVQGATIDLWFPTPADARAWGRRTVTITLR